MKAGSFHEWPQLRVKIVKQYYLETIKIAKGDMNHTRKKVVRAIKEKPAKFKSVDTAKLKKARKEYDVYIKALRCTRCTKQYTRTRMGNF